MLHPELVLRNEIEKDGENFDTDRCLRAFLNHDIYRASYVGELSDNIRYCNHNNITSYKSVSIKCMRAYELLNSFGKICPDTISRLYEYPEIFNRAINDGHTPSNWVIYYAIKNNASLEEIRNLMRNYGADCNMIARDICGYVNRNIQDPDRINYLRSILEIILEEGGYIMYNMDEDPFISSIISGDVIMSRMILDHYGIDNLKVNTSSILGLSLLNNSINSEIVNWVKEVFDVDFVINDIRTMLMFNKKSRDPVRIIHTFEEIFSVMMMFEDQVFPNSIMYELFSKRFDEDESGLISDMYEYVWQRLDHDNISKLISDALIVGKVYGIMYPCDFLMSKGYYEQLMLKYTNHFSNDYRYNVVCDYIRERQYDNTLQ